jgi:hypothetical protein
MQQGDRVIRGGTVEIVSIRMPSLFEYRIVVAITHDELAGRDLTLGDPIAQCFYDVVDLQHRPDGRRRRIQEIKELNHHTEMAVGVDEAGQERSIPEFDDTGPLPDQPFHLFSRPDRNDRLTPNGDAIHTLGFGIDRENVLTQKDDIGRFFNCEIRISGAANDRNCKDEQ